MLADSLNKVLRQALFKTQGADGVLLARFAGSQDAAAFEELVCRHGPMVLRVCKRFLSCAEDAEDAFQATFIVLARRAGQIRDPGSLGCWLHGVARRVSAEAWKKQRRAPLETLHEDMPVPDTRQSESGAAGDLRTVLDEELGRLPEKYRAPLILCYLEGRSTDEVAAQLGWPRGTVAGRLSRARDLLRDRLSRRGLGLSATAIASAMAAEAAKAALPPALVGGVVQAAPLLAGGQPVPPGSISDEALSLANAVTATRAKVACCAAGLLALAALATAATTGVFSTAPARTAAAPGGAASDTIYGRWRFDTGPGDLVPTLGSWSHRPGTPGVMVVSPTATVFLPVDVPHRPVVVSVKEHGAVVAKASGLSVVWTDRWADNRSVAPRRIWHSTTIRQGTIPRELRCYFHECWSGLYVGKALYRLHQYDRPYPGSYLALSLNNVIIEEIEIRAMRPDELPAELRQPEEAAKKMQFGPRDLSKAR